MGEKVHDIEEIRRQVEARREEEEREFGLEEKPLAIPYNFVKQCLDCKEMGDGMLYAEIHRGRFVFDKTAGCWLVFKGQHWEVDILDDAKTAIEDVVDRLIQFATLELGERIAEAAKKSQTELKRALEATQRTAYGRIDKLRGTRGANACLAWAQDCKNGLRITGQELDRNPMLFAVANGVIELRTGLLRDGRSEDFLLKASQIHFRGITEPADVWRRTLLEIYDGNQVLVDFIQRLFGYAITGLSQEHILPVFYGRGRNGKSLIFEMVNNVLGDLYTPIQAEMLLDQGRNTRSSAGPSPDIMQLLGCRIAVGSETDEGRKFSSSRAKWLTGGDWLVGRNPNEKYFKKFPPTHTLFLLTNNKPHAPAGDFAFWERLLLIDHPLSFVSRKPSSAKERPQNKQLPLLLQKELPGILAWLVEGCLLWQRDGLNPPPEVTEATNEYRRNEDLIGDFLDACCELGEGFEVQATDLFDKFTAWYEVNVSKRGVSQRKFGQMMQDRLSKAKVGGKYRYYGAKLRQD